MKNKFCKIKLAKNPFGFGKVPSVHLFKEFIFPYKSPEGKYYSFKINLDLAEMIMKNFKAHVVNKKPVFYPELIKQDDIILTWRPCAKNQIRLIIHSDKVLIWRSYEIDI